MPIHSTSLAIFGVAVTSSLVACSAPKPAPIRGAPTRVPGTVVTLKDTTVQTSFTASGTAQPIQQATLSTKLMGTVTEVLVHEGDVVAAGATLLRIDASDLTAKSAQIAASIADAEAMRRDAVTQVGRIRALYADSAATRAQLDAAETGLQRADAAVRAANAGAAEVSSLAAYSVVRAPFAGVITKRFVDPGAFAAPGTPLLSIQDGRRLRLTANATPDVVRTLRRGQVVDATVEGSSMHATIEGIVPTSGNLYAINALVANAAKTILPGSTATLLLPLGSHTTIVVPSPALVRQGDLTGVTLRTPTGDETRWVRLGAKTGDLFEVTAGLEAGDHIVVPAKSRATAAGR